MSNGGDLGSDFGSDWLDPQERANAQINLDDPEAGDDEPWSPPDRQPRGAESADIEDETIDQRLEQEVPEEGTAYGNPDDEDFVADVENAGGDDPDAIPLEEDFLGDPDQEEPNYDPDGETPPDTNEPAEEAALRVIDDDEQYLDEEDVDVSDDDLVNEDH